MRQRATTSGEGVKVRYFLAIFFLASCGDPRPTKDLEDAGIVDAHAECDACWNECGDAASFNDALICSMWCTAFCNGAK